MPWVDTTKKTRKHKFFLEPLNTEHPAAPLLWIELLL